MSKNRPRNLHPKPDGVASNPRQKKQRGKVTSGEPENLHDVARKLPTADEISGWFDTLDKMSDREGVLAFCALIEAFLEVSIRTNLRIISKAQFNELFRDAGAPLTSFSSRIVFAQALAIVGPEMRRALDSIRRIRNVFAHAIQPLDFSNPTLAKETNKLDPQRLARAGINLQGFRTDPRGRFHEVCVMICSHLLNYIDIVSKASRNGLRVAPEPFQSRFCG